MGLVNKEVIHGTFGKGNVVNYNDSYIKINFESGDKKFVFPDAFAKYMKLIDENSAKLVKKKLKERSKELEKEALELERRRALEQERKDILKEKKRIKNQKIHSKIQSVFWTDAEENEKIFTEWRIFTGRIKSGERKGEPRRLVRMNQNSACLITKRESNVSEENRRILGVFMAKDFFNGRLCKDGYIEAHPDYRLRLSEQESEKMFFWNYYIDKRFPDRMTWNSGRQRYFDNIWMAQILRDIVSLREKSQERKGAQDFFEHFCEINRIDKEQLPKAGGALMDIQIKSPEDS